MTLAIALAAHTTRWWITRRRGGPGRRYTSLALGVVRAPPRSLNGLAFGGLATFWGKMRKQYYFRPSERGLMAWDVDRLIALTQGLPRIRVPLTTIREIDEPFWSDEDCQTWRGVVEHIRLIEAADLSFAIILSSDGRVMDGMHRVAKALVSGRATIDAVRFTDDPEPDYVGMHPNELP